jgi:hypothetical protein
MTKRTAAALISLVAVPLMASAQPADAHAVGACAITGAITFSEPAPAVPDGHWTINQGVINCRGVYNGWERIINPGSFSASGTYRPLPGGGPCAVQLGEGTVDYWVLTSEQDIHFQEPHAFSPGPAGAFTTPTLRGTFQIPADAGCLNGAAERKSTFVAEVGLERHKDPGLGG